MKIRFWGTRGSIPTPGQRTVRYGGNTACVEVRDASDHLLVLDAGTGLRELGSKLNGTSPLTVDLLLSHLHWDHIQGIPFFRPAFDPKSTLRLYGPKQHRPLRELLGLGMDDPFFPVDLDGLPVQLEVHEIESGSARQVGPYRVRATALYHPAPTLAYRIEADGRSVVYATDTEDAFSGQENPVIAFSEGADVLIHDAQFLDTDFKPGWGHSTISKALEVAQRAKVRRLVLYHHDPDRTDDDLDHIAVETQRTADATAGAGLRVVVAREGLELEV
ncbi:MAG TPA: MBL fold metallo-hydrolase [Candidatus Limnocylindria bacterium]|nr:MBL fold metallo-hydrolase [Candidatus Limnocylindria bacterium]